MRVLLEQPLRETPLRAQVEAPRPASEFSSTLAHVAAHLDGQLRGADQQAELAVREQVDVHQAALALERADLELRLLVKVRNKVVDAYREIMRLSV